MINTSYLPLTKHRWSVLLFACLLPAKAYAYCCPGPVLPLTYGFLFAVATYLFKAMKLLDLAALALRKERLVILVLGFFVWVPLYVWLALVAASPNFLSPALSVRSSEVLLVILLSGMPILMMFVLPRVVMQMEKILVSIRLNK